MRSANVESVDLSNGIYTIKGNGFGHGVGLSQSGARVMATKGFTYKEILEYYFPNTVLTKKETGPVVENNKDSEAGDVDEVVFHIVKIGDTLYSISVKYGVTVRQLQEANGLGESTIIGIGQKLKILDTVPEPEPEVKYIVNEKLSGLYSKPDGLSLVKEIKPGTKMELNEVKGDWNNITLNGESYWFKDGLATFGVTLTSVSGAYNEIKSNDRLMLVSPGKYKAYDKTSEGWFLIEVNEKTYWIKDGYKEDKKPEVDITKYDKHIVAKGDTLYSLAKTYDMTLVELLEINKLNGNLISVGQELYVKKKVGIPDSGSYTVVKGDTLYAISKRTGVPVDRIKSINNLRTNIISIGQVLVLVEAETKHHVVVSGDTLYGISSKYGLSVAELTAKNKFSGSIIYPGQKLIIN